MSDKHLQNMMRKDHDVPARNERVTTNGREWLIDERPKCAEDTLEIKLPD